MAKKTVDNMPSTDEALDNAQTPETEFEESLTRQNEQVESDNPKTELEKVGEAMGINPDDMTQEEKDILTDAAKIFVIKGENVALVEGETFNMKITYPYDLKVAKSLLEDESDD